MATVYFDLDGTVYDLYGQSNWLPRITYLQDASAYEADNACMVDMDKLYTVLNRLIDKGYKIGVISWLAKNSNREFDKAVRKAKRNWIAKHLPQATEIHIVKYGTPKHKVANDQSGIIVDDNAEILGSWTRGKTIDATKDIIKQLAKLA